MSEIQGFINLFEGEPFVEGEGCYQPFALLKKLYGLDEMDAQPLKFR
ncbi:MAG: hypothetical protein M3305_15260 [Actinomycetota bacterium]|nr:hypothetical protein [Actinomycetota bacterium]